MTTYSPSLRLWEGVPGDPAIKDAWGTFLNTNDNLIDAAINASPAIDITGLTNYTLTTANGAPDEARSAVLNFSGTLSTQCAVTLPNVPRLGWAVNNTDGGFAITLTTGAGTNAILPNDGVYRLYLADGANSVIVVPLSQSAGALNGTSLTVSGAASVQGNIAGGANITAQGTMGAPVLVASSSAQVTGLLTAGTLSVTGNGSVAGALTAGSLLLSGSVANVSVSPNSTISIYTAAQLPATGTTTAFLGNVSNASSFFGLWQFNGNQIGNIVPTGGGTGTAYNSTSDRRLKQNRGPIEDVGDLIDRLKPRWFTWLSDPDADPEPGFFAQEVHRVWRWAVTKGRGRKGRKGYAPWQMDNSKLVPLLVAEIQDLRRRVADLEAAH